MMCRLFGMLSVKPCNVSKYLINDPCSLLAQSNADPKRPQRDGWGIGYYSDGAPVVIRSSRPVYEEPERFSSVVRSASSRIIVAHIRRASNPRGLPRDRIISAENSQPFNYKEYLFAHNGVINIPDEVAERLGGWRRKLRSLNDSEVYFWYIIKEITNGATLRNALKVFEGTLSDLWHENRGKYSDKERPYVGLNIILSDGKRLYVYCKYQKEDESEYSLCFREQPVFQLSYLSSPTRLIVASEKTNKEDDWQTLKSGQLITASILGGKVKLQICEV